MFFHRPERPEPLGLRVVGDLIDLAVLALAVVLLVVMFANVAARLALDSDIAWNTELGEFVLLWATFLGGAAAARRGAHMRITEFLEKMPPRVAAATEVATRLGTVVLLGLLVWYGLVITGSTMEQEMTVLHWPIGVQYLAMPVGSGLALLFVLRELVLLARGEPLPQETFED